MAEGRLSELVRLGGGREADVFAWDEGRVLRLARSSGREGAFEHEATAMEAAASAGAPVPTLHERVRIDGRPGAIVDRVDGDTLLARLGRRPWAVVSIGQELGRLHARLHRIAAPPALPKVTDLLGACLASDLVPPDVGERRQAELDALPDGDSLCHGDFHPDNVLSSGDGLVVIDWTNASRGAAAADVARTILILRAADLPEGAPQWTTWMDRIGRRLLLHAYLRGYQEEESLDLAIVERWLPVCAAARLAEGIDAERSRMLASARDARGNAVQAPPMHVPRAEPLPPEHRRWLIQNALVVTALINAALNAAIAWVSADGAAELPVWSSEIGETSLIPDTLGTFFLLPLITCVLVTLAVRRELARGELARLGPGGGPLSLLDLLPRTMLARGLTLGALCTAALGPPAAALLALLDPSFGVGEFVAYKVVLTVALGTVVTPLIALRAMADPA